MNWKLYEGRCILPDLKSCASIYVEEFTKITTFIKFVSFKIRTRYIPNFKIVVVPL